MKIILGLGNPGKEYEGTRHNLGFMAADYLREALYYSSWKEDKKMEIMSSVGRSGKEKILIVKPLTFMNRSGDALRKIVRKSKVSPEDVLVIADELDLPWGSVRSAFSRGSAGHKGVESILLAFGSKDFNRIRVGIGRSATERAEKYVLGKLKKEELASLPGILEEIKNQTEDFIKK